MGAGDGGMNLQYSRRRNILVAKQIEPAKFMGGPIVIAKPEKRKPGRPKKVR